MASAETKHSRKSQTLKLIMVAIAGLALISAVVAFLTLNSVLRIAVEKIGSEALGVPVKIAKIEANIAEKSVTISGLRIANPKGFKKPYALTVGTINIALNSVSPELIMFDLINVSDTDIYVEASPGGINLNELKKGLKRKAPAGTDKGTKKSPPKVAIKTLQIGQSTIHPEIAMLSKDIKTVALDPIRLNNIGTKDNAALASDAAAQILEAVATKALKAAGKAGLFDDLSAEILGDLDIKTGLGGHISDSVEGIGAGIKSLFGN